MSILVFYDPPPWKSRQVAMRATIDVLTSWRGVPPEQRLNATAEEQWVDAAAGIAQNLQQLPDGEPVPSQTLHAIDGVVIGLGNVGGSLKGSVLFMLMRAIQHRLSGPDASPLPANIYQCIVLPYRVLDATASTCMPTGLPTVRKDIADAFEAIWMAHEFQAAYDYVDAVIKSGEWTL